MKTISVRKHARSVYAILLVSYQIDAQEVEVYDIWKSKLDGIVRIFPGFINSASLFASTPVEHHYILLRFNSKENAGRWMASGCRKIILEDSHVVWYGE